MKHNEYMSFTTQTILIFFFLFVFFFCYFWGGGGGGHMVDVGVAGTIELQANWKMI